ncbi:MAG: hypothetical protein FWD18_08320 [Micrococcales bacterium]|nr:hypothetical protein [Micrococcales bacterium]
MSLGQLEHEMSLLWRATAYRIDHAQELVDAFDATAGLLREVAADPPFVGLTGEAMVARFTGSVQNLEEAAAKTRVALGQVREADHIKQGAESTYNNLPPATGSVTGLHVVKGTAAAASAGGGDPSVYAQQIADQEAKERRRDAILVEMTRIKASFEDVATHIVQSTEEIPPISRPEGIHFDPADRVGPGATSGVPGGAGRSGGGAPGTATPGAGGSAGAGSVPGGASGVVSSPVGGASAGDVGRAGAADGATGTGTLPGAGTGAAAGGGVGSGFDAAGRALNAGAGGGAALAGGRLLAGQAGAGAGGVGGPGSLGGAGGALGGGAPARVPGQGLRGAFGTAGAGGLPAGGAGAPGVGAGAGGAGVPGAGGAPVGGMVGGAPGAGQQPARRPGEGLRGWGGHIVPRWEDDPDWEPLPPEFLGSDENDL